MIKNPLAIRLVLEEVEAFHGKKVLYIDLDGVVADVEPKGKEEAEKLGVTYQDFVTRRLYGFVDRFYLDLPLIEGAKEAVLKLNEKYHIIFLSAPSWDNVSSFSDKRIWIEKTFGETFKRKMDLTFHKGNYMGHYLIDDRINYGAGDFMGEHLKFGDENYPDWDSILKYLL